MNRRTLLFAVALLLAVFVNSPHAASLVVDATGQLIGANNVNVNGSLFNVTFSDGTCASEFDGCNEASDFAFATFIEAQVASAALRDQVFLDGPLGNFDSNPALTLGCEDSTACLTLIPYPIINSAYDIFIMAAYGTTTNALLEQYDRVNTIPNNLLGDSKFDPMKNLAKFEVATPVPLPAAAWLFVSALAGVGFLSRRRSKIWPALTS